jgi:hypothetical protein
LSENKSFAFLTWATRRTKKTRRRIFLCSSSVLDFFLSCVKLLVGNKFFDGEVECQTEMATYVLFTVDTHTHTDDDTDDTLIFYNIEVKCACACTMRCACTCTFHTNNL